MSTWPGDLPEPLASSFSSEEQDSVIRSQMDVGPAKLRQRFTAVVERMPGLVYILSPAQLEILLQFYQSNRASAFTWFHPRTGDEKSARFMSQPKHSAASGGLRYMVTVDIEVLP